MNLRTSTCRRAMTLLEVLASIVVLGVIGAATLPVMSGAAESYASARDAREAVDDAAFAMDRIVRLLREAPGDPRTGTLFILDAGSDRIEFADGRGFTLTGETLELLSTDEPMPLCRGVQSLEISYLGADGVSDVSATPQSTHRFRVRLRVEGLWLESIAFARVHTMGGGS